MKTRKILSLILGAAVCAGLLVTPAAAYQLPEHYHVYQYYEGFASVEDFSNMLCGYMNEAGELVIPCIYGRYGGAGDSHVGHFHNGRVWVLKENYNMDFSTWQPAEKTWEVTQLDEQGNMVVPWKTVDAFAPGLHMVNDGGVCDDCGGSILKEDEQPVRPEPEPEPEPVPEILPGYRTREGLNIYFAEGRETDVGLSYTLQFTNPTQAPVKGCYALISYTEGPCTGQLMCFDLDLQPEECINVSRVSAFYNLSQMNLVWVSFDSPAEREEFLAGAPASDHEAASGYYYFEAALLPAFLQDNFGITVK